MTLTEPEKAAFRAYFIAADQDRDGMLETNEAVAFLRKSGVDNAVLGQVRTIISISKKM